MFVRLTADAKGITTGTREAEGVLSSFANNTVKKVGTALAGAFAAREVLRFGTDVVREFAEAEAIWVRLATAVDATGASFDALAPSIQRAANEMQAGTRFDDDAFAAALQSLVVQTGDVQRSLGLMGLAADLAAAKQISLQASTELLGKALEGNTTQLTRMFPALKGSTNLFGELQKMVQGMAQHDAATLDGRLTQLNNGWSDFKKALGEAITGATGMKGAVEGLTRALAEMTAFLEQNKEAVALLFKPFEVGIGSVEFFAKKIGGIIHGLQIARFELRALMGDAGGKVIAAPEPPRPRAPIAGLDLTVMSKQTQAVQKVWDELATDLRVANHLFDLIGGSQDELKSKLSDSTSALEQLLRLGVNPTSDGIRKLVEQIHELSTLLEEVGRREIEIPITAVTKFQLQPTTPLPAPSGGDSAGFLDKIAGAMTGMLAGIGTGIVSTLIEIFGPLALLAEVLQGVFAALGPVIDALLVPLRDIGFLIGATLAPALRALQPVIDLVAKAFAFVIQAIGEFIKGLGKGINFLLPGNPANGLVEFGQNMIDMAKVTRAAIDAGTDLSKTFDKVSASVSNVPEIFDLLARRRQAGTTENPPFTPIGTGNFPLSHRRTGALEPPAAGIVVNVNNPPANVDVKTVARQVVRAITDLQRAGGTTEFAFAVNGVE